MVQTIQIPYGKTSAVFSVPEKNLVGVFAPRPVPACPDPHAEVENALSHPIDLPSVEELVRPGERVCILVDDYTRHTPAALILPHLLRRLEHAGVPHKKITILISTGTHRPCTEAELIHKLGREVLARYRVAQHECQDEQNQVYIGMTSHGTPVWVNRIAVETDHLMGIGHIDPSTYAGYAGGHKLIVPGVAALDTVDANHSLVPLTFRKHGHIDNLCRQDIDEAGGMVRSSLFLNAVLNQQGEIARMFSGTTRAVHAAGVPLARQVYEVTCPEPLDIAIGSGYPYDVDFYQACRVIQFMDDVVRPGGSLVMVAPCLDGFGSEDFFRLMTVPNKPHHAFLRDIVRRSDKVTYNVLGYFLTRIISEKRVFAVTDGISAADLARANITHFASAQACLDHLLTIYGEQARVGVFPVGSATIAHLGA